MVGIVILASGFSRRMGEPKLLLPWNDSTILRTVVETALSVQNVRVKVVVNPNIPSLARELGDLPVETVANSNASEGMSTSVRAGIEAMEDDVEAVMILLADQPMMTKEIVSRVLLQYRQTKELIIQAAFEGEPGHPVLIDRALFPELLTISGDQGAREVIKKYRSRRQFVHFDLPRLQDIDTKEDYAQLLQKNSSPHSQK